mmetsp:Transcript_160961/g.283664  ORF Transcript_160961/g.283664 Transcript_160961/m.283664 type:complete len:512 (+) Transcript_160961:117-1652(+)
MTTAHGQDASLSDDCDCVICLETIISADAEGVRPFNCTHRVHGWCAQNLVSSEYGAKCPCCRSSAIVGDLGLSRQYRAMPSQPLSLVDLSAEDKLMFIANAFARDGMDSMKLTDLAESVNSFLLHEGMEVCTKLVLLSELYSLDSSVLALDNAFIEVKIPSVRVVFLDAESLQAVSEWEERKRIAAAREAKRVELANARASEEDRLMREHRLELDRQIAKLRTSAGRQVAKLQRSAVDRDTSKTPAASRIRSDSATASAGAKAANPRTAELAPAEAFSLLCKQVGAHRMPRQGQHVKRPDQHVKRRCLSNTIASKERTFESPRTQRRPPPVEYELEIVSELEQEAKRGSEPSSSLSSSSSSSTSSSSSSSDEREQRAAMNRRGDLRCRPCLEDVNGRKRQLRTATNGASTSARSTSKKSSASGKDVRAKGKENTDGSAEGTFCISPLASKGSSQSASASAASVSCLGTGDPVPKVLRPPGIHPTVKHVPVKHVRVVFSNLRGGNRAVDLDE